MSKQTVGLVVDLTIHEGKFDNFETVAQEMIAGSQKEPGTLAYEWYLSSDRQSCRLVESYTDADAVLAHFTGPVVQVMVPKLLEVASLTGFEVHGDPGAQATEMLAGFGAQIFLPWRGLVA
jgi:quinol monooxygenase YgiN